MGGLLDDCPLGLKSGDMSPQSSLCIRHWLSGALVGALCWHYRRWVGCFNVQFDLVSNLDVTTVCRRNILWTHTHARARAPARRLTAELIVVIKGSITRAKTKRTSLFRRGDWTRQSDGTSLTTTTDALISRVSHAAMGGRIQDTAVQNK